MFTYSFAGPRPFARLSYRLCFVLEATASASDGMSDSSGILISLCSGQPLLSFARSDQSLPECLVSFKGRGFLRRIHSIVGHRKNIFRSNLQFIASDLRIAFSILLDSTLPNEPFNRSGDLSKWSLKAPESGLN
ncbi:hypothetical protein ACS0TY_012110 [Phlomoides rotata]